MPDLQEFYERFTPGHQVIEVKLDEVTPSPFIVLTYEGLTAVINPMALHDHLSVDVHTFVGGDGDPATAGVMAMSNGNRYSLPETGTTSHGWASAELVAVIIGKQAQA